jgi:NAD kinase
MASLLDRKVILVTRRTRLEELVLRFNSLAQARFYIEHLGADFADYQREFDAYTAARATVMQAVAAFPRRQVMDRQFLPSYLFGPDDIVVALGQDGLVANAMKYLDGQPLIGVNPERSRYDGVLLPFLPADLTKVLSDVVADRRPIRAVTMAKATLSDGQVLCAVNDFFIGARSHTSARYEISQGERREVQSSSGVIVSTGLGSTAWMKSVVTGARAIAASLAQQSGGPVADTAYRPLAWDSGDLLFAVREPFPSVASQAGLVFGAIAKERELQLRSLMPEEGVIFSDGVETDYLRFTSGIEARIGLAQQRGALIQ